MNLRGFLKYKISVINAICAFFIAFLGVDACAKGVATVALVPDTKHEVVTSIHHVDAENEQIFDPTKEVIEHIKDTHDWHLWGNTSIPLPVILITNRGIECFASSNFEHGHTVYAGNYYNYQLIDGKVNVVDSKDVINEDASSKIWDFSFTKNVASMYVAVLILIVLFISIARTYKDRKGKAPKGLQSFVEPIILFVRDDIAKPNIGHRYARFMPYLLTIFFFIWINNILGLIPIFPGGANVTGNIAVTFVLGLITFIVTNAVANKYYWKHIFAPNVPVWLYPILIPVEIVGMLSKPFALIVRLFANISAGHIIVLSLVSLIFIFKESFD